MRRSTVRKVVAAALVVCVGASLTGCPGPTQTDAPEPSPSDIVNGTNTHVIRMPDGFRNIAFTCYGPNGIYVTSRGWVESSASKDFTPLPSSVAVIVNDPQCK